MPKRVALFGGAFDPPHLGHQQVAEYLLAEQLVDEVWFVPVKHHPFGKQVEVNGHRVSMLELILEPGMRVETFELTQTGPNYTAQTMAQLQQQHPTTEFSWVIGSDNLRQLDEWGSAITQTIQDHVFWVYPRAGSPMEYLLASLQQKEWLPPNHQIKLLPEAPEVVAASSEIKQRLATNYSVAAISDLVDPRVARYSIDHDLYRST